MVLSGATVSDHAVQSCMVRGDTRSMDESNTTNLVVRLIVVFFVLSPHSSDISPPLSRIPPKCTQPLATWPPINLRQ